AWRTRRLCAAASECPWTCASPVRICWRGRRAWSVRPLQVAAPHFVHGRALDQPAHGLRDAAAHHQIVIADRENDLVDFVFGWHWIPPQIALLPYVGLTRLRPGGKYPNRSR